MSSRDWYEATYHRPPTPLVVAAVECLGRSGRAVEIGAGAGPDTRYLLQRGFQVTAVDADPAAQAFLERLPSTDRLNIVIERAEDFQPEACDLIYSFLSLFFLRRAAFRRVWDKLVGALVPGSVLAVASLGDRDPWHQSRHTFREGWVLEEGGSFPTAEEWRDLTRDLDVRLLEMEERIVRTGIEGRPERHHIVQVLARSYPSCVASRPRALLSLP